MVQTIQTDNAPEALGHYSQATIANGLIFTATQLPMNPKDPNQPKGTIKEQAAQVIDNLIEIVKAGGGDIQSFIKVSVFVSDVKHWDDVNEIYEAKFAGHKPARGVLEIKNIRKGYDVAMEAIAAVI